MARISVNKSHIVDQVQGSDALADMLEKASKARHSWETRLSDFSEELITESEKRGGWDGLRAAKKELKRLEKLEVAISHAMYRSKKLVWALVACRIEIAEAQCFVDEEAEGEKIASRYLGSKSSDIHFTEKDVTFGMLRSYKSCVKKAIKTKKKEANSAYRQETSDKKKIRVIAKSDYMSELRYLVRSGSIDQLISYCSAHEAPVSID